MVRNSRWDMVGSETRNARAISAVLRPATVFSVNATRPFEGKSRVAAGEDQPQPVIGLGRSGLRGSTRDRAGGGGWQAKGRAYLVCCRCANLHWLAVVDRPACPGRRLCEAHRAAK